MFRKCRKILPRFVFPVAIAVLIAFGSRAVVQAQRPEQGPAPVRATTVQYETTTTEQSYIGTVTSLRSSVVGSAVDGRVGSVEVQEGDLVNPEADQRLPLVKLQTGTIDIELDVARVELKLRQAALEQLKITVPSEIEEAESNMAAAESLLSFARGEMERRQKLAQSSGGLSRSELEQAVSDFQAKSEAFKAARILYTKLKATAETRLLQAEAQVAAQSEAIRLLEDRKSKYTIVAPFPGAITRKIAEVGQWITSGQDVIEIVQMDPIEITVNVPQAQLQQLQFSLDRATANQDLLPATIELDSIQQSLSGHVHRIVPQADLKSRSFPVKIRLENPRTETGYLLKPGMLARTSLTVGLTTDKLLVDKDALVLSSDGSSLMVIDRSTDPPVANRVPVTTGLAVGGKYEVIGDIADGQWVVIEGNERLQPGQKVKILNRDALPSRDPAAVPASKSTDRGPESMASDDS